MKALLIIFLWNAGELAITSTPMPDRTTCEAVRVDIETQLNKNKYLKGFNKQAIVQCYDVPHE